MRPYHVAFLVVIALGVGGIWLMSEPRGIRNNNPGNIRHGDDWRGQSDNQIDTEYVKFDEPEYGIRAMVRVLRTYYYKHGLTTIAAMISRWAPPNENNTTSYIASVSRRVGIPADQPMYIEKIMVPMIKAIIHHENGKQPYSDEQIIKAIELAGD